MSGKVQHSEAVQGFCLQCLLRRVAADKRRRLPSWEGRQNSSCLIAGGGKRSQLFTVHVVHAACDATDRALVKNVLLALLYAVVDSLDVAAAQA